MRNTWRNFYTPDRRDVCAGFWRVILSAESRIRADQEPVAADQTLGHAANLQLDLTCHNFGIQEYMPHPPDADEVFHHEHTFQAGSFVVSLIGAIILLEHQWAVPLRDAVVRARELRLI